MKLGLCQTLPTDGNIEAGFVTIEDMLASAAKAGAELVVFPELFLPGYNRPDLHQDLAQPVDGIWIERLSDLAKVNGCGVILGWAESSEGKVYNSAICLDRNGMKLAHYRKIQLFGDMEKQSFTPGQSYETFDWYGKKSALLICYDIEFPQHCRALAELGVTYIFVPTANPAGYEYVSQTLVPARAAEMGVTIIYANYCGEEQGLEYAGRSLIAVPDLTPVAALGVTEALIVAELDNQRSKQGTNSTQLADFLEVN